MTRIIALVLPMALSVSVSTALQWGSSAAMPDNSTVHARAGDNVTLPWTYHTDAAEHVNNVEWYFQSAGHAQVLIATSVDGNFLVSPSTTQHLQFLPNAGLKVIHVTPQDSGVYSVHVVVNLHGSLVTHTQRVVLQIAAQAGPANCQGIHGASGVYTVYPSGTAVVVYCDQTTDHGGWTVIQRRQDGSVDFYRGWSEYERGFGNVSGEFWLGLSNIYRLTNSENFSLRIDLQDWDNKTAFALYDNFRVDSAATNYTLYISGYHGTAADSMTSTINLNKVQFSTYDRDDDKYGANCALVFHSAWWYVSCANSDLNGPYRTGANNTNVVGVGWYNWKKDWRSYKHAEMKIRPHA